MTDDDYQRLLQALAAKHLSGDPQRTDPHFLMHEHSDLRRSLEAISQSARMLKVIQDHPNDLALLKIFREQLIQKSPIEQTKRALEETRIIAAIEDAGPVLFAELRRQAIPEEDFKLLLDAGFSNDEIEILFAAAIQEAHSRPAISKYVSRQLDEAAEKFKIAVERFEANVNEKAPAPRKRKLFNGIGKVLGGAIAGVGNALMATGTILAPNPATAAGAIGSAAVAVPAIMSGIGDLRGE